MKELIFILLVFISFTVCSCGLPRYYEEASAFDYRNHDYPGFVISPTVTGSDYEPLAEISITFNGGKIDKKTDTLGLYMYSNSHHIYLYNASPKRVLNKCILEAKRFGADAILNFKIESPISPSGLYILKASGIAVKLKK